MGNVLIVEDNEDLRHVLVKLVKKQNLRAFAAETGAAALQIVNSNIIDLVFLDIGLPDMNGITLIEEIHHINADCEIVMLTAANDARSAVDSLKAGAVDYLLKPFELLEFRHILNRVMAGRLAAKKARLEAADNDNVYSMIGISASMERLKADIGTAAGVRSSVLVTGETGTGKELVARAIHASMGEGKGVFVKIDCGALSAHIVESELFGHEKGAFTDAGQAKKGLVEIADGGVLFLDEIGNLPLELQPKLLRLLEDSTFRRVGGVHDITVQVKVIAATNADIEQKVRKGGFREDLYYRLNVLHLHVPPLRERPKDVLLLADFYLRSFARELKKDIRGLTPDMEQVFCAYSWPGNVRELKNCLERAVIYSHGNRISSEAFRGISGPSLCSNGTEAKLIPLREMEGKYIRKVLESTGNNKSEAARILGISRTTLRDKLQN